MGLQYIDDKWGYVVEFETLPALPITGMDSTDGIYATALELAITRGSITTGGKYFILISEDGESYQIFRIDEDFCCTDCHNPECPDLGYCEGECARNF